MIAAAGVLNVVATVGVLAVAVPAAAAVTGRVLLEPFVDFSRFARIAVPSENHADAQYESESGDDRATIAKVTPTPALFAKNPLAVAPAVGSADTVDVEPAVFGRKLGPVLVPPSTPQLVGI